MTKDLGWLQESFKALDRVYFGDSVSIEGFRVKWMRWRPNKKTFIYGLCDKEKKIIEINKALQHDWVPDYVVLSTLYHEMLHIVIGDDHDITFDLAESKFVHHTSSFEWETNNLNKLLNCEKP